MKLLSYRSPSGVRLGVRTGAGVLDVVTAAGALDVNGIPLTVEETIAGGGAARERLETLVKRAQASDFPTLREAELDLAPCITRPGKIFCVGLNYQPHAHESNMQIPESLVLFSKFSSSLAGHGDAVQIPPDTAEMDYEAELAIVIGRRCRSVSEEEALSHVFGYCNANDVSARDLQFRTSQWLLGKALDGFCPIGPYLVTADEVPHPDNLPIQCVINGNTRQESNTANMIFSCAYLISYISRYMTLEPGDLILTGTPEGVALGRADKPYLKAGDTMTVTVGGLGSLTNTIAGGGRA